MEGGNKKERERKGRRRRGTKEKEKKNREKKKEGKERKKKEKRKRWRKRERNPAMLMENMLTHYQTKRCIKNSWCANAKKKKKTLKVALPLWLFKITAYSSC